VSCHPNDATQQNGHSGGISNYVYVGGVPNFCLSCHPTGLADRHPENIFPSAHHGSQCGTCHDLTISQSYVDNPNCMAAGCHVLAQMDTRHALEMRYPTAKANPTPPLTVNDFCVTCHSGNNIGGG
jgi:hypothetical protein